MSLRVVKAHFSLLLWSLRPLFSPKRLRVHRRNWHHIVVSWTIVWTVMQILEVSWTVTVPWRPWSILCISLSLWRWSLGILSSLNLWSLLNGALTSIIFILDKLIRISPAFASGYLISLSISLSLLFLLTFLFSLFLLFVILGFLRVNWSHVQLKGVLTCWALYLLWRLSFGLFKGFHLVDLLDFLWSTAIVGTLFDGIFCRNKRFFVIIWSRYWRWSINLNHWLFLWQNWSYHIVWALELIKRCWPHSWMNDHWMWYKLLPFIWQGSTHCASLGEIVSKKSDSMLNRLTLNHLLNLRI